MSRLTASCPVTRRALPSLPRAPWVIVTHTSIMDTSRFDVIDLGRDDWSVIPPAHVVAAVKGGA